MVGAEVRFGFDVRSRRTTACSRRRPVPSCAATAEAERYADRRRRVRIDQQQRLLRKELRKLLPANKDDVAAIKAIAARGYPAVQPILPDLLKWIRDESWPVAKPACEFLVSIGPRLALRLLAHHGIGDPEWITGWLGFKREHHEKRLADIEEILRILKASGAA